MNEHHLSLIKYAQRFELFGELCCLTGSIIYMCDSLTSQTFSLPYFMGSFCIGIGNANMLIQSILTIKIPNN